MYMYVQCMTRSKMHLKRHSVPASHLLFAEEDLPQSCLSHCHCSPHSGQWSPPTLLSSGHYRGEGGGGGGGGGGSGHVTRIYAMRIHKYINLWRRCLSLSFNNKFGEISSRMSYSRFSEQSCGAPAEITTHSVNVM